MRTVSDIMTNLLDVVKENEFQEDIIRYSYGGEEVVFCCPECGGDSSGSDLSTPETDDYRKLSHYDDCKVKKLILEAEAFIAVEKEKPS